MVPCARTMICVNCDIKITYDDSDDVPFAYMQRLRTTNVLVWQCELLAEYTLSEDFWT